jgi:hypothetical protein
VRDFSQNLAIKPQIVLHCTPLDGAEWRADGVITKGGVTDFSSGIQYWEPAWITSNMKDLWAVARAGIIIRCLIFQAMP